MEKRNFADPFERFGVLMFFLREE